MNRHLLRTFSRVFIGIVAVGAAGAALAWTGPLSSAPNCSSGNPGCDAPLNVGSTGQTKNGSLTLNGGGSVALTTNSSNWGINGYGSSGIYGQGTSGVGVEGVNSNGNTWGGYFTGGYGAYGQGAGGFGLEGYSTGYIGVYGRTDANSYGVYGYAPVSGGVGVRGDGASNSWGGYFTGGYGLHAANTSGYYAQLANGGYSLYGNGSLSVSGTGTFGSTVYAPFIYDSNNTGYYLDPNSTSRINYGIFDNIYSYGWIQSGTSMYAPIFYDLNDTSYYADPASTSMFNDLRANVFYDRANTGYYLQPRATSVLNTVYANSYYYNSDARLKKDIEPLSDSLAKVLKLEPVTYEWKDATRGQGVQLGFIAQDVQKVVPELVSENASTTILSVDYAKVTPLLVGAIQTQQQQLDKQQQEIDELKAEVEALKAQR